MNHLEDFISKLYKTIDIRTPEQLVSTNIAEKLSIGLYYWDEKS